MTTPIKCADCANYERTSLFELCRAKESQYKVADLPAQFHTVGHMRGPRGACGEDARLHFQPGGLQPLAVEFPV